MGAEGTLIRVNIGVLIMAVMKLGNGEGVKDQIFIGYEDTGVCAGGAA